MRIVTAGMGLRAGSVLSIFRDRMEEAEIVGYFDPQPSHLDMIGQNIPGYTSVERMLDDAEPDLLFVFSPNTYHFEQIDAGLRAGVRVFTEKPVVTTREDTLKLASLLADFGANRVMVGLVLRHSQHMVDLRAAISAGHLGQIVSIEGNEHIGPYHGAFFMRDWRRKVGHSGGLMLEKCCHDLDIYNMITGSRPKRVASFGGRRSFLPQNAPISNAETEIFHMKKSVWNNVDDPFQSDGDIVDCQTAILDYENGCSLTFHTNINVPDEQRRFCVIGTHGMAEGDFVRGYLKVTKRDGTIVFEADYNDRDAVQTGNHYGADHMMVEDIVAFLRREIDSLPVGILDALEAGVAALALDEAREMGEIVDLTDFWAEFDEFGLRNQ